METTWINKNLQINAGSYGVLNINAGGYMGGNEFEIIVYSYIDCGGKHKNNMFSITQAQAFRVASFLFDFANKRKKIEDYIILQQKYRIRGRFHLSVLSDNELELRIGAYSNASLFLTREQAKKFSGYLFLWLGEKLIGSRKIKKPARAYSVIDVNDKSED